VKKWDNRVGDAWSGVSLPKRALQGVQFSKTGQGLKSKNQNRWDGYPLFKRQRLLLL